ncbi:MAG: hypothetical protein IJW16_07400 [Clostridia bacterium]|nr:hypothetical protein [Clostridia bacterium]
MKKTHVGTKLAQNLVEIPFLLLVGGVGYYCIELAFRGWSHPSMALCGAVCFLAIYKINEHHMKNLLVVRAFLGALLITAVEFFAGCILNLWLGLGVWDYSEMPYHLLGQICLPFFILWFLLCIPVCGICRAVYRYVFYGHDGEE